MPGGAGPMQNRPVPVGPASPFGVMLEEMVPAAQWTAVIQAGRPTVRRMPVVERFSMVDIAPPNRLPAGRELAYLEQRGDLVPEFLPRPVDERPGLADCASFPVSQ